MSNVIVILLLILSIVMSFLLLSIIVFTIALLVFSPRDKGPPPRPMNEKKTGGEDV